MSNTKTKSKNLTKLRKVKQLNEAPKCNAESMKEINSVNCQYWCSEKCEYYY